MNDAARGSIFDPDGVHTGDEGPEPVGEIDDVGSRDAGEEVLGAAGEASDFAGEDGAADDQLVIGEDHAVEGDGNLAREQAAGQVFSFLSRDDADGTEHFRL